MTVCFESSTPQNQVGKKYAEIQSVNVLLFVFCYKLYLIQYPQTQMLSKIIYFTDVTHRIFFKVVHLPSVPILRYCILKKYHKSGRFPLLKRACPTADAVMQAGRGLLVRRLSRQNARRAGWRKGWCTLFYYIPCLWAYTLVLRNISE